jgi:hypothetical protein
MIVKFTNTVAQRRKEKHLAWYRDFGLRLRAARLARGTTEVYDLRWSLYPITTSQPDTGGAGRFAARRYFPA